MFRTAGGKGPDWFKDWLSDAACREVSPKGNCGVSVVIGKCEFSYDGNRLVSPLAKGVCPFVFVT